MLFLLFFPLFLVSHLTQMVNLPWQSKAASPETAVKTADRDPVAFGNISRRRLANKNIIWMSIKPSKLTPGGREGALRDLQLTQSPSSTRDVSCQRIQLPPASPHIPFNASTTSSLFLIFFNTLFSYFRSSFFLPFFAPEPIVFVVP